MRDTEGYIYRYEMHCHTNWCSKCAHNTPQEMAEAYYNVGYAGMVITDHFLLGNTAVDPALSWEEKMRCYYSAVEAAQQWAQGKDFDVLFGVEHQYGDGKEVLTYGIDLPFLIEHINLHMYPLEEYAAFIHQGGGIISMAHPYRHAPYIDPDVQPRPELLDGAEIFNFFNTEEENNQAARLAAEYGLLPTSGGDIHSIEETGIGMAGVALKRRVHTGKELVAVLKTEDYRLIINGELV